MTDMRDFWINSEYLNYRNYLLSAAFFNKTMQDGTLQERRISLVFMLR